MTLSIKKATVDYLLAVSRVVLSLHLMITACHTTQTDNSINFNPAENTKHVPSAPP